MLSSVAGLVDACPAERVLVGVDGRSGAGKSTFADELATRLTDLGRRVVRSTTDSFHRPRVERMRLGPTSPEGYYAESHQLDTIVEDLLHPFANGASQALVAAFDEPSDSPTPEMAVVDGPAVLIFDGLFLQRPEFAAFWHLTVFLDADERRDREWLDFLLGNLPDDPSARADLIDERLSRARWPRYRDGWRTYVDATDPAGQATIVIDNNDLAAPRILRTP